MAGWDRAWRLGLAGTLVAVSAPAARAQEPATVRTGQAAFGDWRSDQPGVWRRLTTADLPRPYATPSAGAFARVTPQPKGAVLKTLPGFAAAPFVSGLQGPRLIRTAPNGDVFVAESEAGRIRVLRTADGAAKPIAVSTFADAGLDGPFGVAFYPAGPDPQWVYVANTNSVVRFPYRSGDLKARAPAETVVAKLARTTSDHITRDLAFSADGRRMFVSVGSGSNDAEGMGRAPVDLKAFEASHAVGSAWGSEEYRADVLAFTPEGGSPHVYAAGVRNCVGLAIEPRTHDLWCSTNERDGLGDNLAPDYLTRVREGGFYGWPWYYMGGVQDPRHNGERPDLASRVITPDVPVQPHSASLEMTFYPQALSGPAAFPAEYRGDAFAAFHGSWNRALRTGYKVVRVKLKDGVPTGAYEDFLTGFVLDSHSVWGRPVGVAVAHDGALLVSEDANGVIWRVAPTLAARR